MYEICHKYFAPLLNIIYHEFPKQAKGQSCETIMRLINDWSPQNSDNKQWYDIIAGNGRERSMIEIKFSVNIFFRRLASKTDSVTLNNTFLSFLNNLGKTFVIETITEQ